MSKLTFSKLRPKANQPMVEPAWRADFRHKDRLPDIKPVRTDFLVNYGLIGLGVLAICFTAWREYTYYVYERETIQLREDVESRKAADRKLLKLSGEFTANQRYTDAFVQFRERSFDPVKLLAEIGSIKEGDMVIRNISVDTAPRSSNKKERGKVVVVGVCNGVEPQNFDQVKTAFEKLKKLPALSNLSGVTVTSSPPILVSNTQDRVIDFTFEIQLVEASKK